MADGTHEDQYDAVVLGAGISGLVAASILLGQGSRRVLVIDEYPRLGGNHIDCPIGGYTFDIGSYIFQDDSPLLAHFPELLPLYVPINPSWGRLTPQGIVSDYPLSMSDDLFAAGPVEWMRILSSVAFARLFTGQPRNAKDFARYWVGRRFVERSGLGNYLDRFFGFPAEQVDIKFAQKRMLWIQEHAKLSNIFRRLLASSNPAPSNHQLARPRQGFSFLYGQAAERLEARGASFLLGANIERIIKQGQAFTVFVGNREIIAHRLVSTIPLDRIQALCGIRMDQALRTVTLLSLFYSFAGERGFRYPILYNFSSDGAWKRLTIHSDFYGRYDGREFFGVEVNAHSVNHDVGAGDRDFRAHVARHGLFSGDLRLEGSHTLENAYPIYAGNANEQANAAIAGLRALGIESIGRQGAFDYQPTARDSTLKAEAALGRSDD